MTPETEFSFMLLLKIAAAGLAFGAGFWGAMTPLLMVLLTRPRRTEEDRKDWERVHSHRASQVDLIAKMAETLHLMEVTQRRSVMANEDSLAPGSLSGDPPTCNCEDGEACSDCPDEDTHLL